MRKEFMKAAKSVGKYLSVAALTFALAACGGEASAERSPNVSESKQSVTQTLPFPQLPASIEGAEYNGKKGCIAADSNMLAAVSANEGLMAVGGLRVIETPEQGYHSINFVYNENADYAYTLAFKNKGELCISEKLNDLTFQNIGNYQPINLTKDGKYEANDCAFAERYGQICGTFTQVSGALQKNGFGVDWQGVRDNGDVLTSLSGGGKSYFLTTNGKTGATVVTGAGKYEFQYVNVPKKNAAQLVARNN
tara:strand:+ start:117114 stop:117866 length:753 start_codon:yes stop_codon:yes gene_type:complete